MNDFADQFRAVLDANPRLTIQGYGISNLYKGDDREGEFKRAREELELHVNLDAIAKAVAWLNTKGRRKTVNTRWVQRTASSMCLKPTPQRAAAI